MLSVTANGVSATDRHLCNQLPQGLQITRWLIDQSPPARRIEGCRATSQHAGTSQIAARRLLWLFQPAPVKTLKEAGRKQLKCGKGLLNVQFQGGDQRMLSIQLLSLLTESCWSKSWKVISQFHNSVCPQYNIPHTYCSAQTCHGPYSLWKLHFVPAQNLLLGFLGHHGT